MAFDIAMAEPWKILFSIFLVLMLAVVLIKFTSSFSTTAQQLIDDFTHMMLSIFT